MRFSNEIIRSKDLILMNLVAEASESLYIFQPGGYFVRTNTSAAGMYAARLQECKPCSGGFCILLHLQGVPTFF